MNGMQGLVYLVIGLGVIIALFLILRELVMWYWKINKIVENQEQQTRALVRIIKHLESTSSDNKPQATNEPTAETKESS